jgi:aspartokinase/homoserine dehydrogenase 1
VKQAVGQDFSENDLREDLSGLDMARKVVILARQLGLDVNLEDVEVESLIPDEMCKKQYPAGDALVTELIQDLEELVDQPMMERYQAAKADDRELRYKFIINKATGKCSCKLEAVDRVDSLFRLKSNENLVAFETSRYITSPLIVKGAAAGPELAAAGIFADLLRLTRTFSSLKI